MFENNFVVFIVQVAMAGEFVAFIYLTHDHLGAVYVFLLQAELWYLAVFLLFLVFLELCVPFRLPLS